MSLLDTLRKNLTPDQLSAVQDALGDDFNYDVVPRSRLNKVIQQRDEARRQLAGTPSQGGDGGDGEGGEGGGSGGAGGAPKSFTQADIDAAVNAEKSKHQGAITTLQKRYAVTAALQAANFVDPEVVLGANLIDLEKITVNESGVVTGGLDDQVTALATNKPYLVNTGSGGAPRGTGKNGGSDQFGAVTTKEEFLKLSTADQIKFKAAHPETFKSFLQ